MNVQVIFAYTRADALADGVLIDATPAARELGLKYPVALTAGAWAESVAVSDADDGAGQSEAGRLRDVLYMLRMHATGALHELPGGDESRLVFRVLVWSGGQTRSVVLHAVCGPGDSAEPVITVMLPGED